MTFLRTKGTGNFKVTKKSTGAYLRCRYDASEKAENETPPAENETSSIAAYLTDSTIGTPIIHIDAQSGNKEGTLFLTTWLPKMEFSVGTAENIGLVILRRITTIVHL